MGGGHGEPEVDVTTKRGGCGLAVIFAALLALSGCRQTQEPAGPPIRIGAYYWPGQYWMDIAHRKGWFAEAGLNVEWVDTNPDFFGSFDQLVDGRLDIVNMSQFDFLLYNARGKRLTGFAAGDYTNGAEAIAARPGIGSMRELAGERLALSSGTYLEYLWSVAAERAALDPASVTIVDAAPEKAPELLAKGEADAILTWEPFVSQGLAATQGARLFDTSQVPGVCWAILAARPEFLEGRATEVHKLLQVWERTTRFIQEHPDEAYAIVAEVNRKTPAEVREFAALDHALDLRENLVAFSYAGGFESVHGSSRRMLDFMYERGMVTQRPDTGELFDARFLHALAERETTE